MNRNQRTIWLGFVFLLAFSMRAFFLLIVGPDPQMALAPDSGTYLKPAKNLVLYGVFSSLEKPPIHPDTARTPGYPFFLAFFFRGENPHIQAIRWTQALMDSGTAVLVSYAGYMLWASPVAALTAGVFMAVDFLPIRHTHFILSDVVFVFTLTVGLLLFIREAFEKEKPRFFHIILCGLIFGFASLIRPVGIFYFLVPSVFLFFRGAKMENVWLSWLAGAALIISALLPPLIWMGRNHRVTGVFSMGSTQGFDRAVVLEETLSGTNYEEAKIRVLEKFEQETSTHFDSAHQRANAVSRWSIRFLTQHPQALAKVLVKETIKLMWGNGMKAAAWLCYKDPNYNPATIPTHPLTSNTQQIQDLLKGHPLLGGALFFYLFFLGFVYLLCIIGFWSSRLHYGWAKPLFLVFSALYFFLVTMGIGAYSRYRLPMLPFLFLLAGYGFKYLQLKTPGKN